MIAKLAARLAQVRPNQYRRARQLGLTLAGHAGITAAAWTLATPLGLLVAGLSALVLEWQLGEE